jgi:hypothetical protein
MLLVFHNVQQRGQEHDGCYVNQPHHQILSGVLSDPTAMLFGLEEEFSVLTVDRCGPCAVKVNIEQIARDGPVP